MFIFFLSRDHVKINVFTILISFDLISSIEWAAGVDFMDLIQHGADGGYENPRTSNHGGNYRQLDPTSNTELIIEGFDCSGFHLRVGDFYYCAKNHMDLIAFCIDFFGESK